jgi:hypothetical protein
VTLSNATGGTFRLASEGYVTTPLAYDAASQLTAASDLDSSYAISDDNLGRVLTVDAGCSICSMPVP